jgi:CheY-like chemotaxis protein
MPITLRGINDMLDLPGAETSQSLIPTTIEKCSAGERTNLLTMKQSLPTRVLLAEDDGESREITARMLEKLECQVEAVATGGDALAMAARYPYDVIFMDCLLPEMNGFEASDEIRELETGARHVPIVALIETVMEGDSERCLEAGMDDWLPKPVTREALQMTLERWTGKMVVGSRPSSPSTHAWAPDPGPDPLRAHATRARCRRSGSTRL